MYILNQQVWQYKVIESKAAEKYLCQVWFICLFDTCTDSKLSTPPPKFHNLCFLINFRKNFFVCKKLLYCLLWSFKASSTKDICIFFNLPKLFLYGFMTNVVDWFLYWFVPIIVHKAEMSYSDSGLISCNLQYKKKKFPLPVFSPSISVYLLDIFGFVWPDAAIHVNNDLHFPLSQLVNCHTTALPVLCYSLNSRLFCWND